MKFSSYFLICRFVTECMRVAVGLYEFSDLLGRMMASAPTVCEKPQVHTDVENRSGGHGFSPKTGTLLSASQTFPLSGE